MEFKRLEWLKISRVVTNAATVVLPFQGGWGIGRVVPGALPLAMELRLVGAGAEPTGPRRPMVHEGLAQGGEPREETSAKEMGVGSECGALPCRQPLTYSCVFM